MVEAKTICGSAILAGELNLPPLEKSAFFSYSRADSEFSQRLAADLKAAGAIVWLDKLDIAPGQRWDGAIEDALKSCPRLLLVLSPSSVASENVKDEVSFAIESGKAIIPVLHRDCEVPFRLRRFQYIDFRTDYECGLQELLKTLQTQPSCEGFTAAPVSSAGTVPKSRAVATSPQPARSASARSLSSRTKYGLLGGTFLLAALLAYFMVAGGSPTIASISPASGPPGAEVTISGKNLGGTQGSSVIKFGTASASVVSWSPTSGVVKVPNAATGSAKVVVSVNDKSSDPAPFNVTSALAASSISPATGPPGTPVTINGTSFGTTQGNSLVRFGTVIARITYWSANSISAVVPDLRPGMSSAVVSVDGLASTPLRFIVSSPLSGKAPANIPAVSSPEYERVKERLTDTNAQAGAVLNQWHQTQAEVARGGGSLRTDEQSALNSLKSSMVEAGRALQAGNVASAAHSLDTADREIRLLQQYAE